MGRSLVDESFYRWAMGYLKLESSNNKENKKRGKKTHEAEK